MLGVVCNKIYNTDLLVGCTGWFCFGETKYMYWHSDRFVDVATH